MPPHALARVNQLGGAGAVLAMFAQQYPDEARWLAQETVRWGAWGAAIRIVDQVQEEVNAYGKRLANWGTTYATASAIPQGVPAPTATEAPQAIPRMAGPGWASRGSMAESRELKNKDIVQAPVSLVPATPFVRDTLCPVVQGTSSTERVGRRIMIKNLGIKLNWARDADGTVPIDTIKIYVVLDTQCNKNALSYLDYMSTANTQSFRNLFNKNRFKTLHTETIDLQPTYSKTNGTSSTAGEIHGTWEWFKTFNDPIRVEFDAAGGLIGTITSNNLSLIAISRFATTNISFTTRIRFTD